MKNKIKKALAFFGMLSIFVMLPQQLQAQTCGDWKVGNTKSCNAIVKVEWFCTGSTIPCASITQGCPGGSTLTFFTAPIPPTTPNCSGCSTCDVVVTIISLLPPGGECYPNGPLVLYPGSVATFDATNFPCCAPGEVIHDNGNNLTQIW